MVYNKNMDKERKKMTVGQIIRLAFAIFGVLLVLAAIAIGLTLKYLPQNIQVLPIVLLIAGIADMLILKTTLPKKYVPDEIASDAENETDSEETRDNHGTDRQLEGDEPSFSNPQESGTKEGDASAYGHTASDEKDKKS